MAAIIIEKVPRMPVLASDALDRLFNTILDKTEVLGG